MHVHTHTNIRVRTCAHAPHSVTHSHSITDTRICVHVCMHEHTYSYPINERIRYTNRLSKQLTDLCSENSNMIQPLEPPGLGEWDSDEVNYEWVNNEKLKELGKAKPTSIDSVSSNEIDTQCKESIDDSDFDDLRYGDPSHEDERRHHALTKDQLQAFETALQSFLSGEQLLMFIHGVPGRVKQYSLDVFWKRLLE